MYYSRRPRRPLFARPFRDYCSPICALPQTPRSSLRSSFRRSLLSGGNPQCLDWLRSRFRRSLLSGENTPDPPGSGCSGLLYVACVHMFSRVSTCIHLVLYAKTGAIMRVSPSEASPGGSGGFPPRKEGSYQCHMLST